MAKVRAPRETGYVTYLTGPHAGRKVGAYRHEQTGEVYTTMSQCQPEAPLPVQTAFPSTADLAATFTPYDFLLIAAPPAPRPAERPRQLALLPGADSAVASTSYLF